MSSHEQPALWETALEGSGNVSRPFASEESRREALGLGGGRHLEDYYLDDDDPVELLAGKIVAQTLAWAGGDPEQLELAARILARTPYLEGGKTP